MHCTVPLLSSAECDQITATLRQLPWQEGHAPGELYREKVKRNQEISLEMSPETKVADDIMATISRKLMANSDVRNKTFAKTLVNPRFSLCENGGFYAKHADSAFLGNQRQQVRTDISLTLFLSDPDSYRGGELSLEYACGDAQLIKPAKGSVVFYPSGVMHEVRPVTDGQRICFVGWIQSHIQDPQTRSILNEITTLCDDMMADPDLALGDLHTRAQNIKHNLFRRWWRNNG